MAASATLPAHMQADKAFAFYGTEGPMKDAIRLRILKNWQVYSPYEAPSADPTEVIKMLEARVEAVPIKYAAWEEREPEVAAYFKAIFSGEHGANKLKCPPYRNKQ